MALQPIGGGGYDYVQNTEPSSPTIGETWLDTSTNAPDEKIYADVGSGGSWVKSSSSNTIEKIYNSMERRISEIWSTSSDFSAWSFNATTTETTADGKEVLTLTEHSSTAFFSDSTTYSAQNSNDLVTHTLDVSGKSSIKIDFQGESATAGSGSRRIIVTDDTNGVELADVNVEGFKWYNRSVIYDVSSYSGNIDVRFRTANDDKVYMRNLNVYQDTNTGDAISPVIPSSNPERLFKYDIFEYKTNEDDLPASNVTIDILDSSDNVIISDLFSGQDISSIDVRDVKIKITFTRGGSTKPYVDSVRCHYIE